jgi:hypothetical protein
MAAKKSSKKENPSILWRVIRWIFRNIWRLTKWIYKILTKGAKKGVEKTKLMANKTYNSEPKFKEFMLIEEIKGNYKLFEEKIQKDSLILLIFGKRGSGKSSLGFRILENIHDKTKRKCYVLGIDKILIPKWIKSVDSVEKVPDGGIILIDEGAVSFGSRDSMSSKNKELSKIMAVARHKSLTLIFVTQNTGLIDRNVLALTDALFIKEGSLLQMEMERPEVKKFYEKSNNYLKKVEDNKKKYFYLIDSDFEGVLTYSLPSFWSDKLSKNKSV